VPDCTIETMEGTLKIRPPPPLNINTLEERNIEEN
jgi:hypothetical protein